MIPKELQGVKPLSGKDRLGAMRDSEYLGVEDIEPGSEPVLTISALYNAKITLQRGKEQHDVITFSEESVPGSIKQVRPLVVNATNRKTLRKLFKSVTAETLVGKKIKLFVDPNVRNPSTGEKDGGIRIRDYIPKDTGSKAKVYKCADCGKEIKAVGTYSAEQVAAMNKTRFGREICADCSKRIKAEQEAAEQAKTEPENSLADALNAEAAE
jgi:DNA-directed RNA polymerase subunit RPC12/RpoP